MESAEFIEKIEIDGRMFDSWKCPHCKELIRTFPKIRGDIVACFDCRKEMKLDPFGEN